MKNYILFFLLCLSTLSTTPIALIKTSKLVLPAFIKGSGKPVGWIEPVNISYCTMIFATKKEQITDLFVVHFCVLVLL